MLAFKRSSKKRTPSDEPETVRLSDTILQKDDQLVFIAGPLYEARKDKAQRKALGKLFSKLDSMDGRPEQEYLATVVIFKHSSVRKHTLLSAGLHGVSGLRRLPSWSEQTGPG